MTTRRGSVAALAGTVVELQLLCVGMCTAADPVVPVSARSFAVDVVDMSIEVCDRVRAVPQGTQACSLAGVVCSHAGCGKHAHCSMHRGKGVVSRRVCVRWWRLRVRHRKSMCPLLAVWTCLRRALARATPRA